MAQIAGREDGPMRPARDSKLPFISVVITVLNVEATIADCIESILGVDYPRDAFEVIVVDGGSKDSTLVRLAAFPGVKILQDLGGTIGSGRNVGIRKARGDVVAITDGDMTVDKRWLSEIATEFRGSTVGAVGGPIWTKPQSPRFSQLVGLLPEESLSRLPHGKVPHDLLYTRNAAYRRSVLEQVGLFNESLVAAEDPELNWRVENAGYDLVFSPRILVYHSHRSTLGSFIKQHFRNGVGCGQLAKVNPRIRHTKLKLLSAAAFLLGLLLLIAFFILRHITLLYVVEAMALGYALYCIENIGRVYRRAGSVRAVIAVLLLMMTWPPFWALGVLYGLTTPVSSVHR